MHTIRKSPIKASGVAALASAFALALSAPSAAQAGNQTGTFQVNANLSGSCTAVTASAVSLSGLSGATTLTLTCTSGIDIISVGLAGANDAHAPSGFNHAMANGGNYVGYNISATAFNTTGTYTDASSGAGWVGFTYSSTANTSTMTATSSAAQLSGAASNNYSDTVTVTVNF